ncbi:hypothetical protein EMWEY_00058310 [Eimeria maxima]|uniref:Uncharacterized protein n=1 Tax=Eimeria maxima TaxID=5804 RepID=U6LYE6_EIMMA|nr:hypothetical protein EMWEY_00058310 [Eimeria maxima]CDJ56761.1 hypothetical protein EMWEY_00058310 [Eimeria maxima]
MSRSEGTAWLPAAAPKRKSARRRISNDSLGSASTRVIPSPSASPKVSISARLASSPRASSGSDAKGQSPEDWLSRDVEGSSPKAEEQGPPGGQSLHNSPIRMGLTDCPEDASTSEAAVHTGASFESDDGGAAGYNSSKVAEQGAHKLASDQQLLQQESLARDGAQQEENVVDSTTGAEQDAGKLASDQQLLQEETLEREGEQQEENVVDSSTDAEQGGAKLASEQELLQEETLVRGEGTLVRDGAQSEESVVDSSMGADSTMDAEQGTAKMASVQELLQEETLVREGAQQAEERVDDVGDVLQPSTSAGQMVANVISEEELAAEGRDSFHPFVRLPKVSPKNVTKTFDGFGAFVSKIPKGGPMSNFLSMRELFAKPSLNAKDVQQLMADCTGLVAYACKKLAGPPSRTNAFYIVRKLASMVMVFDYVVSTLVLLGKKMDAKIWWSDFVGRFHTDFNFEPRTNTQRVTEGIVELIQQLSAALTIYKTGKRPSNGTVIQLKRDILSNLRNSCIFENPSWILWEEDDSRFKQTSASSKK